MNEEEIAEFIEQVNGVQKEYKYKPIHEKNVENIGMAIQSALNLYQQEKEKNKKLEEVINNLAKGVRYLGTNEELTTEDIIKMFSPEEIKIDFDDFMKRWENEQHKKADLKDKVIDLMLEDLLKPNYICSSELEQRLLGKDYISNKKKQAREYYFKKARGE